MYRCSILSVLLLAIFLNSCSNDDNINESISGSRSYLDRIQGTYSGIFVNTLDTITIPGSAEVTLTNTEELQIHCFGEDIDTTWYMDAFLNDDFVMLCLTGEDFQKEYGHEGHGYHMGSRMHGMEINDNEWLHHLEEDHDEEDNHFGGFAMGNHTFSYSFKIIDNGEFFSLTFNGVKK